MAQTPDLIDRYARLTLAAERYQRSGHAVPAEMVRAIQAIEARATSTLSPEQMRAAQHHVSVAKSRIIADENRQGVKDAQARRQRTDDNLTKRATRGMLGQPDGLTVKQLEAVRNGKPVHIPSRTPKPTEAPSDEVRRLTKVVDKRGKGFTSKEWEERLDDLVDARPERFDRMAEQYNVPRDELRKAVDKWEKERVDFEIRRRHGNDKGETRVGTDREQLRAEIVDAMHKHAPEQIKELRPEQRSDFVDFHGDFVSDETLEEDSMRGDIGRAWATVDARERDDAATVEG